MTQIISAIQQKGGAGKSAMLCCLAGLLVQEQAKVLIIDTDPQQTASKWAEMSDIENLDVVELINENDLTRLIEGMKPNYDVIMIDTAGFDSRMATYAMGDADLVLIPTNGSKNDVIGATATWQHVTQTTRNHKNPPVCRIVFWAVKTNTSVYAHARAAFEGAKVPTLPGAVKNLTGFDNMTWNGGLPDGAALQSILGFQRQLKLAELLDYYKSRKAA